VGPGAADSAVSSRGAGSSTRANAPSCCSGKGPHGRRRRTDRGTHETFRYVLFCFNVIKLYIDNNGTKRYVGGMSDEQRDARPAGPVDGSAVSGAAVGPDGAGNRGEGCQFPTGPGMSCGRPIERSGLPGAPSRYCELPGHNRAKAFAARRAFQLAATGMAGPGGPVGEQDVVPMRPVTDGRTSFGVLLAQFGDIAAQTQQALDAQQRQLGAILDRAAEVARTVADPEAAAYEVDQVQRETGVRIAEAQGAQAAAERDAREQRRRAETEAEQRAQADDAAEQALREVETVRAQTAETIARITADTDAAVAEQQARADRAVAAETAAREELDRVRAQAAEQVAAAHAAAEQHRSDVEAERDRVLAEQAAEMRREIEQVRTDADARVAVAEQAAEQVRNQARTEVLAAQQQAAEAGSTQTRAEADRAAAERRASEDRATLERVRAELEQLRTDHHDELVAARREAAEERAALRREAGEQLTAVLARFDTASGADTASPPAPARRGHPKPAAE
jgi:colicin import membrane protein